MKKYYLTLVILLLIFSVHSQKKELIGTWEGNDEGVIGQMTFDKDGFVYVTIDDETIGGPSYNIDGTDVSVSYILDTLKSPYWLDIIVTLKSDHSQYELMLGIVEFSQDYTEMKICLDFGEGTGRPKFFIPDDTMIMFKKE